MSKGLKLYLKNIVDSSNHCGGFIWYYGREVRAGAVGRRLNADTMEHDLALGDSVLVISVIQFSFIFCDQMIKK